MEPPKGRYSVVEKDGRLIVIDNRTGSPAASNTPSPRPGRPNASVAPIRPMSSAAPARTAVPSTHARASGPDMLDGGSAQHASGRPAPSASPIAQGKGTLDSVADALVAIASKGFDSDGRAIVGWEWKSNLRTRRWDARLDAAQQRRFGRALLAMLATPLPVFAFVIMDGAAMWTALAITIPAVAWGYQSLSRLQKETGGIT